MKLDDEKLKFAMKTWLGSGIQSDEKLKIENLPEVDKRLQNLRKNRR